MKRLWLIQRGVFEDIELEKIEGIDSLISFEYMGSAEFEWGALPKSLRRIIEDGNGKYGFVEIPEIKNSNDEPAFTYCLLSEENDVKEAIQHLSKNDYGYKESAMMSSYINNGENYRYRSNFWWDIQNDFFVLFGEEKRDKLQIAINKMKLKWDVKDVVDGRKSLGMKLAQMIKKTDEFRILFGEYKKRRGRTHRC